MVLRDSKNPHPACELLQHMTRRSVDVHMAPHQGDFYTPFTRYNHNRLYRVNGALRHAALGDILYNSQRRQLLVRRHGLRMECHRWCQRLIG